MCPTYKHCLAANGSYSDEIKTFNIETIDCLLLQDIDYIYRGCTYSGYASWNL